MSEWFVKDYYKIFNDFREQVLLFNKIGGKEVTVKDQLVLCYEESRELVAEFGKDKIAFLSECCDLFIVSSPVLSQREFADTILWVEDSFIGVGSTIYTLSECWDDVGVYLDCSIQILKQLDADWQKAMQLVLDSNMSKFSKYDQGEHQVYDNHCKVLECGGRYSNVTWQNVGGWVVWKDESGKILKGLHHVKADLSGCVN